MLSPYLVQGIHFPGARLCALPPIMTSARRSNALNPPSFDWAAIQRSMLVGMPSQILRMDDSAQPELSTWHGTMASDLFDFKLLGPKCLAMYGDGHGLSYVGPPGHWVRSAMPPCERSGCVRFGVGSFRYLTVICPRASRSFFMSVGVRAWYSGAPRRSPMSNLNARPGLVGPVRFHQANGDLLGVFVGLRNPLKF